VTGAVVGAVSGDSAVVAIGVTIVATVVIMVLLAVVWTLIRTMQALRATADDVRRESLSLLDEMRGALGHANHELDRVDGLLGTAESISATVDSASRLAYVTLANPVVKVMAFGTGTAKAARRLRRSTSGHSKAHGSSAAPMKGRARREA
jgi:uncharacterized protein YoxC